MSFGKKIATLRKEKGFSQDELAKKVGIISITIGRYERDEINPSVDTAAKIAEALNVSLDYLVGNADTVLEKSMVKKITDIQKLSTDDKNVVIKLIDAFLRDTNAKQAYAQ
ncbi:MAG: helix-turn-helix domain-containing protein [Ferruginibacter sp.]|jgi:transcriptional regulator with XRE-family HTH domain